MQIDNGETSSCLHVARVMQHVVSSLCFPQKDVFVILDLHAAFEEDALASSHPLNPPQEDVQTISEIIEMFDTITYNKVWQQLMIFYYRLICRLF